MLSVPQLKTGLSDSYMPRQLLKFEVMGWTRISEEGNCIWHIFTLGIQMWSDMVLHNCDCTSNLRWVSYLCLLKPCVCVLEPIPSNAGKMGRWRGGWMKAVWSNGKEAPGRTVHGQRTLASGNHKISSTLINHKLCTIIYTTSNSKQF